MLHTTINILLTFLLLETVTSDQLRRIFGRYGKYRRSEQEPQNELPSPIDPEQLKEANPNILDPVKKQLEEENVQLLPGPHNTEPLTERNVELLPPNPDLFEENIQHRPSDSPVNIPENRRLLDMIKWKVPSPQPRPVKINPYRVNFAQEKMGQRWPMGVVPYFINKEVYDPTTVKRIVKQMSIIEMFSCVIFRELTKKPDTLGMNEAWLHITNPKQDRECVHEFSTSSANGTEVVLGFDCLHPNEILHSLFHAIGFNDEVSHPHRDQYIRVLWENIQPKYRHLFRIQFEDASYKLAEYDPTSIMHFHDRAFSANGAATIATLVPGLQISSTSQILSQLDIMKLKLTFGHECNKRKIAHLLDTCKNSLYPHKKVKNTQSDKKHTFIGTLSEDDYPEGGKNISENDNPENGKKLSELEHPVEDVKEENDNEKENENKRENPGDDGGESEADDDEKILN